MKNKYTLGLTFFMLLSNGCLAMSEASKCDKHISTSLIKSFETGLNWDNYFTDIYQKVLNCNDQANIGILNIIDEMGYPVGLPIHFEYKKGGFYFASNILSERNKSLHNNPKVSLLIYYKSIDQSTFLIKGKAIATPIKYQYSGAHQNNTQVIYKIEPSEVNVSFLNNSSRSKEEIIRHLYVYKKFNANKWSKYSRLISIQTELDDLEENLKRGSSPTLSRLLPD